MTRCYCRRVHGVDMMHEDKRNTHELPFPFHSFFDASIRHKARPLYTERLCTRVVRHAMAIGCFPKSQIGVEEYIRLDDTHPYASVDRLECLPLDDRVIQGCAVISPRIRRIKCARPGPPAHANTCWNDGDGAVYQLEYIRMPPLKTY